jgi:hypothetical protein
MRRAPRLAVETYGRRRDAKPQDNRSKGGGALWAALGEVIAALAPPVHAELQLLARAWEVSVWA